MKINSCKDLPSFLKAKKGFEKRNFFLYEKFKNHTLLLFFTRNRLKLNSFLVVGAKILEVERLSWITVLAVGVRWMGFLLTSDSDILGEFTTTTDLGRIRFRISVSISISRDSPDPSMIPNSNDLSNEMVGKWLANNKSQ